MAQVDAHEIAQCLGVVDRVFHRFICQAILLLHKVHAQHALRAARLTSTLFTLGEIGLDDFHQPGPRHHQPHLVKEHFSARTLLLLVLGLSKIDLGWRRWIHVGPVL